MASAVVVIPGTAATVAERGGHGVISSATTIPGTDLPSGANTVTATFGDADGEDLTNPSNFSGTATPQRPLNTPRCAVNTPQC